MLKVFNLMLLLALPGFFAIVTAAHAQTCRSESEIPASTPSGQFVDHGDETVTDSKTGLMWIKCQVGMSGSNCTTGSLWLASWQDALAVANSSTYGGHGDWRLPNVNELSSIIERQCYEPAINLSVFPSTPTSADFWSSTPGWSTDEARQVDFRYGDSGSSDTRISKKFVRLVRGGK